MQYKNTRQISTKYVNQETKAAPSKTRIPHIYKMKNI